MIRGWIPVAALTASVAASSALADGAPPVPPAQGWSGKGELG